jgi:hypothetical protein
MTSYVPRFTSRLRSSPYLHFFRSQGLDDNWQKCGAAGAKSAGTNFHDKDGNPIVNTDLFPNMKDMTDHAHSLKLTAGWYGE